MVMPIERQPSRSPAKGSPLPSQTQTYAEPPSMSTTVTRTPLSFSTGTGSFTGTGSGGMRKPSLERRMTLDVEDVASQHQDPPPHVQPQAQIEEPAPERPYQGVGRLIDQWQKKSEEATRDHAGPAPAFGARGRGGGGSRFKQREIVAGAGQRGG